MIIYLAPTLLLLVLGAVAGRVRSLIEPECPSCSARRWHGQGGALACSACGWTSAPAAAAFDAGQLA